MLREIHELLGIATAFTLGFTASLGLVLFFYPQLRSLLPFQRSALVRGHRWGAIAVLFVGAAHILTTDRYALPALAGAAGVGAAGLVGLWLRRNRQHFRQAVRSKLALVVLGGLLLLLGHATMEHEEEAERHGHARSGAEAAPGAGAIFRA